MFSWWCALVRACAVYIYQNTAFIMTGFKMQYCLHFFAKLLSCNSKYWYCLAYPFFCLSLWDLINRCRTLHPIYLGINFKATLFIQYRFPVGLGPSSNTCPRWESHCKIQNYYSHSCFSDITEPQYEKTTWSVFNETSDQPAYTPSLLRVFVLSLNSNTTDNNCLTVQNYDIWLTENLAHISWSITNHHSPLNPTFIQ